MSTPQPTPPIHLLYPHPALAIPLWFIILWIVAIFVIILLARVIYEYNERQRQQWMIRRDEQEAAEEQKRWPKR